MGEDVCKDLLGWTLEVRARPATGCIYAQAGWQAVQHLKKHCGDRSYIPQHMILERHYLGFSVMIVPPVA